ncbi:MAG: hypothetical protein IIA45_08365 [Bacteroidetes bacterium]|nr:hypothetical protein [Bacteroidota bacterium]
MRYVITQTIIVFLLIQFCACEPQENDGIKQTTSIILECSVGEFIRELSDYSADTIFNQSLKLAEEQRLNNEKDIVTLFGDAFTELDPEHRLAIIFATRENKIYVDFNSTNEEVLLFIRNRVENAMKETFDILESCIDQVYSKKAEFRLDKTKGAIYIKFETNSEPNRRVRTTMYSAGRLEFWETWNNEKLIIDLVRAEEKIRIYLDIKPDSIKTYDSAWYDNPTLFSIEDTTHVDAIKRNSLFDYLTLAMENIPAVTTSDPAFKVTYVDSKLVMGERVTVLRENFTIPKRGPVIGIAHLKDTTAINGLLAMDIIRVEFPPNIKFLWGKNPIEVDQSMIALYAIKTSLLNNRPPLDATMIKSAKQSYDRMGSPNIIIKMNKEGSKIWQELTAKNINRYIAIVFDDRVYSAPIVLDEIVGGRVSIEGIFTLIETKAIANAINCTQTPMKLKLIREEYKPVDE